MNARHFLRGVTAAVLLGPAVVVAQTKAPDPNIAALRAAVERISQNMVTKDDLKNLVTQEELAEVKRDIDATANTFRAQSQEIRGLKDELDVINDTFKSQLAEQRRVLEAISEPDSQGNPILDLRSAMQSRDFRQDMSAAVNNSMQRRGTLQVVNRTGQPQSIRVNDAQYEVDAHASREFNVPVGTVTTELVGYETPKHLTVAPPRYFQRLLIKPESGVQRRVAWRVADDTTTTYYAAPTTTYYATPTTTYYAAPVTTYYATPTTTYYAAPTTTYYAAPVTTYYTPATTYYSTYYGASYPRTAWYWWW